MRIATSSVAKWTVAAALCAAAAFALLLGVGFPRLIREEALRESVGAAVGREFRYASLELAYFPPRIILDSPTLGGVDGFFRADRAVMRISLLPLLARVVLVDSASIEGAVLQIVRSAGGVALMPSPDSTAASMSVPGSSVAPRERAAMRFAVRSLHIPDALLVLEDRTVSPPIRWELRNSQLQLQMKLLELRPSFTISGEFSTGGHVVAEGEVTASGEVDASVRLEEVSIAPGRSYFASGTEVDGALSGTIDTSGSRVEFELALKEGRLTLGQISLRGLLAITGKIDRQTFPSHGQVEVDATAAELRFGEFFTKPPGTRGLVRGLVTSDAEGALTIDAWKFEMDDFDGRV